MASPADRAPFYGMEALASLPVFFKLDGRIVVIAGAGPPAVWKAELLAAADAAVRVFDDAPSPEMLELAARLGPASLTLIGRRWSADDLAGAALAIGAIEDDDEAARFRAAAREAGLPVNIVDKPAFCDFQFGTILARSPIAIGISTDGAAPVFGQALRARIEAVLPLDLGRWAIAAKEWRPAIQARGLDFRGRRRFWEAFSRFALSGRDEPTPAALEACLASAIEAGQGPTAGRVILVGSGQGTPEATTLGAIAALQSADCVIHDPDVSPAVVGLARREAEKRSSAGLSDQEIAALAGSKVVAWLGTGDPATCERWQGRCRTLFAEPSQVAVVTAPASCPMCPDGCRFRAAA